MSVAASMRDALAALSPRAPSGRHGLQLGFAVVLAFLASAALGLPEGFWAVMSTLIVVRPDTGATLGAGWDRVRGTVLGTVCGLIGVWLRHAGGGMPEATLAIVALLAFASAGAPILRSAPITALIILSSGAIAGHSALQVAGLRVAEITVGVTVGLAISVVVPAARAAARFDARCAAVLRRIGAQVARSVAPAECAAAEREASAAAMRAELRQLVLLGESVDRESSLLRFNRAPVRPDAPPHRRIAQLVSRVHQDATLLGRVFDTLPKRHHDPIWPDLWQAAHGALESVAGAVVGEGRADLVSLRRITDGLASRRGDAPSVDEIALLLAGPLRLLTDDLRALAQLSRRAART